MSALPTRNKNPKVAPPKAELSNKIEPSQAQAGEQSRERMRPALQANTLLTAGMKTPGNNVQPTKKLLGQ